MIIVYSRSLLISFFIILCTVSVLWFANGIGYPTQNMPPEAENEVVIATDKDVPTEESPPRGLKRYVRAAHFFTIDVPAAYSTAEYVEDEMGVGFHTYVFEDPSTFYGFQIYQRPDPTSGVGNDDISRDLPDIAIRDAAQVMINGVSGIMFVHGEGELTMREVWLHYNGNLFEITALSAFDTTLSEILKSFRFAPLQQ